MHSRLGGDLNLLPTEWQPHVLITKHCHIHMQTFFCSIYQAVVSVDLVCKESYEKSNWTCSQGAVGLSLRGTDFLPTNISDLTLYYFRDDAPRLNDGLTDDSISFDKASSAV